ncbi:MAG: sulfotransferase [Deltaproteobacteria bacterium]|nr:sulfotransferase [Deltaproteobacteria bacterium]
MFNGPLFVVGAPRSGTKLFRDLLRQHSRIGIPIYETEYLPRHAHLASELGELSDPEAFSRFYAWVTRFMYFKYMAEDGTLIPEQTWREACRSYDVQGVFEALIRHDAEVGPDDIWGDKSPNYRAHLPLLRTLWPQARFIHIIRDARDVCLSSHKAWKKAVLRNAQRWTDEVAGCRRDGRALAQAAPGERVYHELRYEDLLQRPEAELSAVCAFLELPFEEAMTRPGRVSENLGDTRGEDRIVAGNTEKWRERMAPRQLEAVEAICGELLQDLGYPLVHPVVRPARRLSKPRMTAYQALDAAQLLRFRVKEWGWRDAVRYTVSAFESTRA